MATLTIELSDEVLAQLQTDAKQQGKAAEVVAQELIAQQLEAKTPVSTLDTNDVIENLQKSLPNNGEPLNGLATQQGDASSKSELNVEQYRAEREKRRQILKEAGLLVELDPELAKRADPTVSIEKVREALSRDGKPMSEIAIEQRGPLY